MVTTDEQPTEGAVCELCDRDMTSAPSCLPGRTVVAYSRTVPAPWWSWQRWLMVMPERCRDCGVAADGAHHVLCCVAVCASPGHEGWQRLTCGCDEDAE